MNLPYFYKENINSETHILSEETSKHCIQVLRMKEDEQLQLTNGKGNLFTATITDAGKKYCTVKITKTQHTKPKTQHICIAISLLKNASRFEWFLEKATEIGIAVITPLICEHTEKEHFRFSRMQNILIAAMLQSRQTWLPQLHQPKKFAVCINQDFDGLKLIAHCVEEEKKAITGMHASNQNKLIFIGPEGDFSKDEISIALQKKYIPVTLGNTRLRTETAGIVAVTLLNNMV